jgi:hypothetical protein
MISIDQDADFRKNDKDYDDLANLKSSLINELELLDDDRIEEALIIAQSYNDVVDMCRKHCGLASKGSNEIIADIISASNNSRLLKTLELFNIVDYGVKGFDRQTNSNNHETLVFIWKLKEIANKNNQLNLESLVEFFENITPKNETELAIYLFNLLVSNLRYFLETKLTLINSIDQILILNNKPNLDQNTAFVLQYYDFLTRNHYKYFRYPINDFSNASVNLKQVAGNDIVITNSLNVFDVIESYDVPGYNEKTNTNIRETFHYMYHLCSINNDFGPLLTTLKNCVHKSIDELACELVKTWAYLQYQQMVLKQSI